MQKHSDIFIFDNYFVKNQQSNWNFAVFTLGNVLEI